MNMIIPPPPPVMDVVDPSQMPEWERKLHALAKQTV